MPSLATLSETYIGRRVTTGPTSYDVELVYKIYNCTDQHDAANTIASQTPLTQLAGLLRRTATEVTEVESTSGLYEGRATYSFIGRTKQVNDTAFNFDTSGGTQHIVSNLLTTGGYPVNAPNPKGLINATESSVDGIDINVPQFCFSGTLYLPIASVTNSYMNSLYTCTGGVNNAPVTMVLDGITMSFDTGELLFLGASGSRRGSGELEISFKFSASPNVVNQTIGDITGIAKKGWDYLEVRIKKIEQSYQKDGGGTAIKLIGQAPQFVFTHKVYKDVDMSLLRIPTS